MPPDPRTIGTPQDWLDRARSNLPRARQPRSAGIFWEDLCFDAQQVAEKSLKAVLLARQIPFRFVHDIAALLTALEANGLVLPAAIRAAASLTDYAVATRYPGIFEPVTEEEFQQALLTAEAVFFWAEKLVQPVDDDTAAISASDDDT